MAVDLLAKTYLIGAAVFILLFMYYPSALYSKEKLAELKATIAESPLSPKLEAVAITIMLAMVAAMWPWWLTKRALRKLGVIK